jgi:MFS family permease
LGGAWAGTILLPFEHARASKHQSFITSFSQTGRAVGTALGSVVMMVVLARPEPKAFENVWRAVCFSGVILLLLAAHLQRSIEETHDFKRIEADDRLEPVPIFEVSDESHGGLLVRLPLTLLGGVPSAQVLLKHGWNVFWSMVMLAPEGLVYAVTLGWAVPYLVQKGVPLSVIFASILYGSVALVGATIAGGAIADRVGRRRAFCASSLFLAFGSVLYMVYMRSVDKDKPWQLYLAHILWFGVLHGGLQVRRPVAWLRVARDILDLAFRREDRG